MSYEFQTFSFQEVLTSSKMNQIEINIRDHVHGSNGVSPALETGMMIPWAGDETSTVPTGYLLCDGSSVSRTIFAALFAVIGTAYGSVDGTTFNVPDMRGRAPIGVNNTNLSNGKNASYTTRNRADTGGAETHSLTSSENGQHSHTGSMNLGGSTNAGQTAAQPATNTAPDGTSVSVSVGNSGSGTAHNIMQPFLATNWLIKT